MLRLFRALVVVLPLLRQRPYLFHNDRALLQQVVKLVAVAAERGIRLGSPGPLVALKPALRRNGNATCRG